MADERLTWEQLHDVVGALPTDVLSRLALGPIEREGWCRVCTVLKPIAAGDGDDQEQAAARLVAWHDAFTGPQWLDEVVTPKLWPAELERAKGEIDAIFGAIQYYRCCMIYSAASSHLALRREGQRPGGASILEVLAQMMIETERGSDPFSQMAAAGVDAHELAAAITELRLEPVLSMYHEIGDDAILGALGEAFVSGVRWERERG